MKRFSIILASLVFLFICSTSWADIPNLINFQGILDSAGNPMANKTVSVEFKIYDTQVGGALFWSETQSVTTNAGGVFNVLLGSSNPIPDSVFKDTLRYLGIKVGTDAEMSPRQQIVSNAYGYRVSTVDGASGGTITSKVSIGPGHTNTGADAFVAGNSNTASGDYSTVGGGQVNTASGLAATVGGGQQNTASGVIATVGGGYFNIASGSYATVPGGSGNVASGSYSFAAGAQAKALHDGTFVWSDGNNGSNFSSTKIKQFLIHADSGVGIGTNSPTSAAGGQVLHINNAAGASALRLGDDAVGGKQWEIQSTVIFGSGALNFSNVTGGTNPLTILASGDVGIGTTTPADLLHVAGSASNNTGVWTNLSDRRLKTEIQPIQGALETVEALQGVSFRWKDAKKDAEYGRVRGLIAQDVEKILPEWVKTDPDGYKRLEPIGIDALLIEAIKELKAENVELKNRISELEKSKPQAQVETDQDGGIK